MWLKIRPGGDLIPSNMESEQCILLVPAHFRRVPNFQSIHDDEVDVVMSDDPHYGGNGDYLVLTEGRSLVDY